ERVTLLAGQVESGPAGSASGCEPASQFRLRSEYAVTVRVLIADDQELVRAGFAAVLGTQPDLEVVAEASTGRAAVDMVRAHRPDVVLMDIRMPDLDGIAATAEILRDPQMHTRVLILTTFDLDEYVLAALRTGASGFLVKDSPRESLCAAVRTIAAGGELLAPSVTPAA
ncbi:MAG TPA: response regulator transcription factor, partial [Jiangellaceae bacterium]|nr:response regulator transcription factor [Jiangellaceae bacterium]